MAHVAVELDKRTRIAELLGALPCEEPALVAALLHGTLAARVQRLLP